MGSILWLKLKRMRTDVMLYAIMMLMALVLSYIFGSAMFGDAKTQNIYVIDYDETQASSAFLEDIGSDAYTLTVSTEREAERAVSSGEALAAIVIPEGFEDTLDTQNATVTLVRTAQSADIYALQSAVTSTLSAAAQRHALTKAVGDALTRAGLPALTDEQVAAAYAARMGENAAVRVVAVASGNNETISWGNVHYLMGFNIFFVMFSIVFTIGGILEDRKLHTWDRIRISPVSGAEVLGGHFVPTFAVGVLQMLMVLGFGQMLFGIDLGASFWPIIVVFAAFVLAATCLGLLLSMLIRTYDQLGAVTPVVLVATSMLGGCMWPLSIVGSKVMLGIAQAMPQKWALEAAERLAIQGGSLGSVMGNIGVLVGMATVFFAASLLLYNKKQKA